MYKWRFEQLGGEKKVLELDGYQAPFGRPRQKALFTEIIKVNIQTTRYPGSKGPPTRHIFGSHWEDMELTGRWMSKTMTRSSETLAATWSRFVRDEQRLRVSWGNVLSYTAFIEELHLGRESADEIVWKMKLTVDKNDEVAVFTQIKTPARVAEVMAEVTLFLSKSQRQLEVVSPDMSTDFVDALGQLAAIANVPSAFLARFAGELDDLEKGTFTAIQQFRNAVTGLGTSLIGIRETILTAEIDSVMVVRHAETDIAWLEYQLEFDAESSAILASLRELDRRAELYAQSEVSKIVTAEDGDTWESLAIRATGGISRAGEIRTANGAKYGERPVSGVAYLVP